MSKSNLLLILGLFFIFIAALLYSARAISIAVLAIPIANVIELLNEDIVSYANGILPMSLLPLIIVSFIIGLLFLVISLFSIFFKYNKI
ncbi:uncharacterized protein with PQ loop repeat [Geomicrobium sediminis]|uniref:Uncharacterized protein with PQ loop repeat n=1 Tax=Geomicrobium sediminis TaxID=1347788 RepID=A0ABS2PBG1_9BACL|nr:uncharacterized protein with PQ loop repeat [Geomicrobium sediminis]